MAFAALLATTTTSALFAQSYQGGIRGAVTDQQAAVMAGTKVTLLEDATGSTRSALSNDSGGFDFTALNPSTYTLMAEKPGFKKFERKNLVLGTSQELTIDVKLEVGSVSESVLVTEEIPLIEVSNASQGQVLDNKKLVELPNLGRNPFMMSKLAPNVIQVGNPAYNRMQDQSGSSSISISGGPVRGNNYLLDGVPITDAANRAIIIPTLEAVQEVKVQANTYDSEMARTGGGMFNTLIRSGGNRFHGSAYGHLRRTSWDANSFFNNAAGIPITEQPNSTWGASLTGHISIPKLYDGRNRTFFSAAIEQYDDTQSGSSTFYAPTALERAGDFSKTVDKSGKLIVVSDPFTHVAYTGNKIPASAINKVGQNIMNTYVSPATTPAYFGDSDLTGSSSLKSHASQKVFKLDETFANWWRASASYARYYSLEPGDSWFTSVSSPSNWRLQRRVDATAINNSFTLSPTTVLTVRYGFNRFPNYGYKATQGYDLTQLGLPSSLVSQIQNPTFPILNYSTAYSMGTNNNFFYVHSSKNFSTNVAKYVGKHALKAGFDYRRISAVGNDLDGGNGQLAFTFDGTFTGNELGDLLTGYPYSGSGYLAKKLNDYANYYGLYVQDDYRLTSKLTLNFGLRWERELGLQEANNGLVTNFAGTKANPLAANVTGISPKGYVQFAGTDGANTHVGDFSGNKFGPRVGAAYQLNSKTTVRAGYGLFYAPQFAIGSPFSPPGYTSDTSYIATLDGYKTPAGSLSNPFPSGLTAPLGNSLGTLTAIGQSFSLVNPTAKSPRVHQFSVDVQRQLPFGIALQTGYVGSRSSQLGLNAAGLNLNALDPSLLGTAGLTNRVTNPFFGKGGTGVIGTATVGQYQLLLPYPTYGSITASYSNYNHARYDSAYVKAQKSFSNGLTFLNTITFSRNLDASAGGPGNTLNGGARGPQNPYNTAAEYGLSNINTPWNWASAVTYELPIGKGKMLLGNANKVTDLVIGGWSFNTVGVMHTGFPLQISQSTNNNSIFGYASQRPNATGTTPVTSGSLEDRLNSYINPAAFSTAVRGTFGNLARTINMRGPGQVNFDASLFKNFAITEQVKGQFRLEALNATNTPLFYGPNVAFGSGSFGKITSQANFARQLQMALRFSF
jgi:hypothetical protein